MGYEINGTTINQSPTIVLQAGEELKDMAGKAIKIVNGKAVIATAGVNAIGIVPLSEGGEILKGHDVTIQIKDIGAWVAGGEILVGDELTSDDNGCAVKAVVGNFITAVATTAADEAGTIIRAQFIKAGYKA